tara:strand:- start:316 stop:942 length:627 start_codon:yes stop_codon:yes gene_type:complete
MKLFLSSEGVPRSDLLRELLGVSDEKVKVALISNAQDPYPEDLAKNRKVKLTELFNSLDFKPTNIDLREYEGKTDELAKELRKNKLIWVSGGNVFWLRYVMKTSGFDRIIKDLLSEGIVYGGWSAGAVVTGPSLNVIELMDFPDKAPEIIWEGLNIVDYFIWPHWDNEKYVHLQTSALDRIKQLPYESVTLRDGEALIIENSQRRLVK